MLVTCFFYPVLEILRVEIAQSSKPIGTRLPNEKSH